MLLFPLRKRRDNLYLKLRKAGVDHVLLNGCMTGKLKKFKAAYFKSELGKEIYRAVWSSPEHAEFYEVCKDLGTREAKVYAEAMEAR